MPPTRKAIAEERDVEECALAQESLHEVKKKRKEQQHSLDTNKNLLEAAKVSETTNNKVLEKFQSMVREQQVEVTKASEWTGDLQRQINADTKLLRETQEKVAKQEAHVF